MDTIQAIFSQLGANSSFLIQFVIVIALFIITKILFFNKLQFVIETREEKTSKTEGEADGKFEQAKKIGEKYKEKIDNAYKNSQTVVAAKKSELSMKHSGELKKIETEMANYIEKSRAQLITEIEGVKQEIMSEGQSLSDLLVKKISG